LLKDSGLDGIGFDVMGDMDAVKEVYGLHVSEKEYIDSLHAISDSGLSVFPMYVLAFISENWAENFVPLK